MKVHVRFELQPSNISVDLFELGEALMDALFDLRVVDPSTDVDSSIGRVGIEFVVRALDIEDATETARSIVEEAFERASGIRTPPRITHAEQTVLAPA